MKIVCENKFINLKFATDNIEESKLAISVLMTLMGQEHTTPITSDKVEEIKTFPTEFKAEDNIPYTHKKLVFAKCKECGETFCGYVPILDGKYTLHCRCGNTIIDNIEDTFIGSYECSCGQKGVFNVRDGVEEVKCKNCEKIIKLKFNPVLERYVGVEE